MSKNVVQSRSEPLVYNLDSFNHEINETTLPKPTHTPKKLDHRYYCWLVVLASFLMQACSFGVASGFGVFVDYYALTGFPNAKYTEIALIGTVAPTTIAFASMVTGRLCDLIGIRKCILVGTVLMTLSLVLGSFATEVWHLIVTQGFMFGLGGALAYVPANTVVAHWFTTNRGLAFGIGTSGIGIGGLVFSLLNSYLLHEVDYQWTLRYNAIIVFVCLGFSTLVVRLPTKSENEVGENGSNLSATKTKPFNIYMLLNSRFIIFGCSTIAASFAYLIPLYYLPSYAVSQNFTVSQGATLVAIVNGASAASRIFLGLLSDKVGHLNVYLTCLIASTLTLLIWRFSTAYTTLIVFSVLYGIPAGGFAGGFPAACAALFGLDNLSTIMGFAYAFTGIGDLSGPLIAGHIIDSTKDYNILILYGIALYALSSLFMFLVKVVLVDRLFLKKVEVSNS